MSSKQWLPQKFRKTYSLDTFLKIHCAPQGIQQSNQSQTSFCLRAEGLSSVGLWHNAGAKSQECLNYVSKEKKRGRRKFLHKHVRARETRVIVLLDRLLSPL